MHRRLILPTVLLSLSACSDHRGSAPPPPPSQVLGVIAFESRVEVLYDTPRADHALVVDLDRDGRMDMVAVDPAGRLAVRFGQGGGEFASGRDSAAPVGAFHLMAGDLNGDLAPDLVVVARDGDADALLNDGGGELASSGAFMVGADLLDSVLQDVDGDGALDLVCVHVGGQDVLVFDGIGDGTFRSPVARPLDRGTDVTGLSVGDLDGDGRAEIVCCDVGRDRIVILPGSGGSPTYVSVRSQPIASAIGDLGSDGTLEIVVAHIGVRDVDVLGRTPGGWSAIQSLTSAGIPYELAIGDVDGDGANDLLFTEIDRRAVVVHRSVGQSLDVQGIVSVTTGTPIAPQLADIDGDGRDDLFVPAFGGDRASVFPGREGGFRGGRLHEIEGLPSPEIVQIVDLITPGVPNLVTGGFGSTAISVAGIVPQAGADPQIEAAARIEVGRRVQNVVPADLDADGRTDLVVAVEGGIKLVRNGGPVVNFRYSFEVLPGNPADVLAAGAGPFEVAVGDVDEDGFLDIVIAYHESDKVAVLRGTSTPFVFEPPLETPLSGRPLGLAIGDYDGDGSPEVAVGRLALATISVLRFGPGGLELVSDTAVGPGPLYLRTADFDRDGRTDLVVSESAANRISMLIALPAGGFRIVDIDAGQAPTALATLDLNRDGNPDILVASLIGADFRVLLGDGNGGVAQALRFAGVYGALTAAVADLDSDGLEDLAIGGIVSRGVAVFRNVSRRE